MFSIVLCLPLLIQAQIISLKIDINDDILCIPSNTMIKNHMDLSMTGFGFFYTFNLFERTSLSTGVNFKSSKVELQLKTIEGYFPLNIHSEVDQTIGIPIHLKTSFDLYKEKLSVFYKYGITTTFFPDSYRGNSTSGKTVKNLYYTQYVYYPNKNINLSLLGGFGINYKTKYLHYSLSLEYNAGLFERYTSLTVIHFYDRDYYEMNKILSKGSYWGIYFEIGVPLFKPKNN